MKPIQTQACCPEASAAPAQTETMMKYVLAGIPLLAAWWLVYSNLEAFSGWFAYDLLKLSHESHFGGAVAFFVYDTPKVLLLLTLVVFGVGLIRSFFTPDRTRKLLAGRRESAGNVLAALLGIVTPFCTCSAVPLFIGFVTAGVPLGVTFSFLISAPMVNEIAVVLLYGLFGWRVAAIYLGTGLLIAMLAGWVIGKFRLEHHLEDWVLEIKAGENAYTEANMTPPQRIRYGLDAVRDIVGRVWLYVVLGIAVGAAIHGYVPEGFMASIMGREAWWAIPVSVLIGIPMYSNAAGIIPIVHALLEKGAALGTVLAFMMSVIALSLPEAVILRKVLKPTLIAVFFGVVGFGIILVGYIFNLVI
ncbi:MAG: permease [Desulfobacteraceae bacterium]|nr:permease [Desulfobacteraceae bacterium]